MKILLVEDDAATAGFIIKGLKQEGFTVDHAADGDSGLDRALFETYDAAIIDIMLPGRDGLSLITELRKEKVETPLLILSALKSVDKRVLGLQTGADDYLVKPFAFSELIARLHALIRRTSHNQSMTNSINAGPVTVDLIKRRVFITGEEIVLQPKEYALLEYLVRNEGRVVSKTMIMENVWDYNFDPQTNVVEARICRLREKLQQKCEQQLIHTVRGMGYMFEAKA